MESEMTMDDLTSSFQQLIHILVDLPGLRDDLIICCRPAGRSIALAHRMR